MKLSDLQNLLTRVQSIAGDVEVVLKAAETEAETVITDLGIHLNTDGSASGTVQIEHGQPKPAADPEPAEEPAEGPAADAPIGS